MLPLQAYWGFPLEELPEDYDYLNQYDAYISTFTGPSNQRIDYRDIFDAGHFVVACGFDRDTLFFQDPSERDRMTSLSFAELPDRWHVIDKDDGKLQHVGVVITRRPFEHHVPRQVAAIDSIKLN